MTSTHSWRRRVSLAIASAGALLLTPFVPLAAAADNPDLSDAQVSYYSFDGDVAADSWGERSGVVSGDVPTVEGKVGTAASIIEGNSIAYPTVDLGADWTVGFWVKAPTAPDKSNILQSTDGVRAISQRIDTARGDKMGMYVIPGSGGFLTYESTLPNDVWTHITWTQSSTQGLALYVNGEFREIKSWSVQNPIAVPADVLGGVGFTGLVDELKIYNRALTAEEVPTTIENLEPAPIPELNATFTVTNPKPEGEAFEPGDIIRFDLRVTNDTGVSRSFEAFESNLHNWEGCKWANLSAGDTQSCPFPTYTVTEEDAANGAFTPSITFRIYDTTTYSGHTTQLAPFEGAPVAATPSLVAVDSFEFTDGTGKDSYAVGDELTAAVTIRNPITETVSFTVDEALACAGDIAPGESFTCESLTYAVTSDDLERGEANFAITVNATAGERTGTATATATIATPTIWPEATPFPAPNADPRLAPELSDLLLIEAGAPEYNIRIPAIAVASNGDILASYDLRPKNGVWGGGDSPNENSIVQRRSQDGGKTWGPMTTIAEGHVAPAGERYGWSDPSYVVDHETGEIFNFFVGSLDAGLPNGPSYAFNEDGTIDETHRRTMNFTVASSTDNGHTWELRTITDDVLGERAANLTGCFATSGAGTQKQYEPYKGRLLQQAACGKQGGGFLAITIFSDDNGKTWQGGNFASDTEGTNGFRWSYDENKVVELSDGRLMLNSRIPRGSHGQGYRLVAISEDGGMNWGEYHIDNELQDSQNNAQLLRPFPSADSGTLRSKVLLFSNTKRHWDRVNGHVSMSYDDGETWPVSKQIRQGGTGYTTMAVQADGKIGLLMEPQIWTDISYLNFSLTYLEPNLPFEVALSEVEDVSATDGVAIEPIEFTTTGNDPVLADTFTVEGLPAGLEIDPATGTISGTPAEKNTEEATFDVTVTITEAEDGTTIPRTSSTTFTMTLAAGEVETPVEPEDPPTEPEDPPTEPEDPQDPPVQPMDPPAVPSAATNRFGEATGDRYADVWAMNDNGEVHFYRGAPTGLTHRGIVMVDADWTSLAKIPDMNGDNRADLLVRDDAGRLFYYYSTGDGFLTKGPQVGHGWAGFDQISYAGRLGNSPTEYVIARKPATGELYRYTIAESGMHSGKKIGHGWNGMDTILTPGNIVGSSANDIIGIDKAGRMIAYRGLSDGSITTHGQIGHGWTQFDQVLIPGDVDGNGTFDMLGIRGDGRMFFYANPANGWFSPAVQVGHGWGAMKLIS